MKKYLGFTLIELMIAVAVLGILAVIAIPAYQNYTIQSKIGEVMRFSEDAKHAVAEYYLATGTMPSSNGEAGLVSNITGSHLNAINVTTNGLVVVTTSIAGISGTTIEFEPIPSSSGITWSCMGGTVPSQYRPSQCR